MNVSHYVITINNQNTGEIVSSGYLAKGQVFTVANVTVGAWTAKVDAYIQNEKASGGYVRVASATSNPVYVPEKGSATLTVTLDSILDALSGDVTITAMLPSNFTVGSTVYAVWSLKGESNYSLGWDKALTLTVGNGNTVTFTLDADNLLGGSEKLKQGVWTMTLEVSDSKEESGQTIVKKGVEVMRLLAGLPASGIINLSAESPVDDGLDISVTDQTGDLLQLGSASISTDGEGLAVNVGYNGIPVSTPVSIYVDGDIISSDGEISYSETDITNGKKFLITGLPAGEHTIMISLADASLLGAGSITFKVTVESQEQEITGDVIAEDYVHFTSENMVSGTTRYKEIDGLFEWVYPKAGSTTSPKGNLDGYIRFSTGKEWKYVGSVFLPHSDDPGQILGQIIFSESGEMEGVALVFYVLDGSFNPGLDFSVDGIAEFITNADPDPGDPAIPSQDWEVYLAVT